MTNIIKYWLFPRGMCQSSSANDEMMIAMVHEVVSAEWCQ